MILKPHARTILYWWIMWTDIARTIWSINKLLICIRNIFVHGLISKNINSIRYHYSCFSYFNVCMHISIIWMCSTFSCAFWTYHLHQTVTSLFLVDLYSLTLIQILCMLSANINGHAWHHNLILGFGQTSPRFLGIMYV
jgi:hypothetical protein